MNSEKKHTQNTNGIFPEYKVYERQNCFVAQLNEAEWNQDIESACAKVLPEFDLEPCYANEHYDPTKPPRDKVTQLIANARYGIYDLSSRQDRNGEWQAPHDVFIELGMAIALNRPALLLRHTSNEALQLPECLRGVELLEFAGEITLKHALQEKLPQWFNVPPDRDWMNRFCIFGHRLCGFRDDHPRAKQWGQKTIRCHISDGLSKNHPSFQKTERSEIRGAIEEVFSRFNRLTFSYLDELSLVDGYQFLFCSYCQTVRSTPFAVYRILPHTPAETFIAIGMSIALETLFEYNIPKVFLVRRGQEIPSLLRGFEVIEADSTSEVLSKLKTFIPIVMQKVRETEWKPITLPFESSILEIQAELVDEAERRITPVRNIPFQAPSLPSDFVARVPEIEDLKAQLMSMDKSIDIISLQGLAGVGKTMLTAALAHETDVQARFPDGILWSRLGREPDVFSLLTGWLRALGDDNFFPENITSTSMRLRSLLRDKACLLVLDYVWEAEHIEPFLVGGPDCRMLITTRNTAVTQSIGAHPYNVMPTERKTGYDSRALSGVTIDAEVPPYPISPDRPSELMIKLENNRPNNLYEYEIIAQSLHGNIELNGAREWHHFVPAIRTGHHVMESCPLTVASRPQGRTDEIVCIISWYDATQGVGGNEFRGSKEMKNLTVSIDIQ